MLKAKCPHAITFLHMVYTDELSNCLELIKWMFFVLYSRQQNVLLSLHHKASTWQPLDSLSLFIIFLKCIYPIAFVCTSFQFSVDFSDAYCISKKSIFSFSCPPGTQQSVSFYRNSVERITMFIWSFVYLFRFFVQSNFSTVILIKIVLGADFLLHWADCLAGAGTAAIEMASPQNQDHTLR